MKNEKNLYIENPEFQIIRDQLTIQYDSETVKELLELSFRKYKELLEQYPAENKLQKPHLQELLSYMAIYLTLKAPEENPAPRNETQTAQETEGSSEETDGTEEEIAGQTEDEDFPGDAEGESALEIVSGQIKSLALEERKNIIKKSEANPASYIKKLLASYQKELKDGSGFDFTLIEKEKDRCKFSVGTSFYRNILAENECLELAGPFTQRNLNLYTLLPKIDFSFGQEDAKWIFSFGVKDISE